MAAADCAEQDIEIDSWDTPLPDPGTTEVLREALAERLWLSWEDAPETPTFGALVLWIEGEMQERWRLLSAVTDPDREALEAVLIAARTASGHEVGADTLLRTILPEERRPDLWRQLPPPWDQGRAAHRTVLRPAIPRTLFAVGLWLALLGSLLAWPRISLRVTLFWWGIAALFVAQYGLETRQEWIDTPGSLAERLVVAWRNEVANLAEQERVWSGSEGDALSESDGGPSVGDGVPEGTR